MQRLVDQQRSFGRTATVLLVGFAVIAAGCSSSKSKSPSSGNSGPSGSSATGSASTGNSALQDAQTFLNDYLAAPKIGSLPSLSQKPTGKTFVIVGGLVSPVFTNYDAGVHQACELLGCNVKDLGAATTTAQQAAAYHAIQSLKPAVAILYNFNQDSLRSPVLTQIAQSGTKVLTITGEPSTKGDNLPYNIQTNDEKKIEGQVLASWVAVDSKCNGAALVPYTPATGASVAFTDSFADNLTKICPSMNVTKLGVLPKDIGTKIPGQIVASLRSHTDINYLVGPCPIMTGTNQALVRAGLVDKVKGVDDVGTKLCDQELKDKSDYLKAVLDLGYLYSGWNIVGAGSYLLAGQDPPAQVFNKVSYPMILHTDYQPGGNEYDSNGNWVGDNAAYTAAFKQAWGLGS
jgi:hypothetical protein